MINPLNFNMKYLEHITKAMDEIMDDGFLALGTPERDEQEKYFGEGREPEDE